MLPSLRVRAALIVFFALAIVVGLTGLARAQEAPSPAYIARVEGVVTLEHDGQAEPAAVNVPLVGGDRLFTEAGRAEIAFPDGTSLVVEENSEVDFESPTRFRVVAGAIERRPAVRTGSSSPYLPENLQTYAPTLDEYGTWQYDALYGYVWYPAVTVGWRPYYYGYWSNLRPYGWTWIGLDAWAWPTHHYGRWGYSRHRWFWIPGHAWGPGYVSWGVATSYVSWCPLGPDNAPLFALSFGAGRTWSGWTFVPRSTFGYRGYYASHYAVEPWHIARTTPFIQERRLSIVPRAGTAFANATEPLPTRDDAGRSLIGRPNPARPIDGRGSAARTPQPGLSTRPDFSRARAPVAVPRTPPPVTASPDRPTGPSSPAYRTPSLENRSRISPYRPPPAEYRRAPDTFAPIGDFRRPEPNPSYDYRRPIQEARPPAAPYRPSTPEYRAPAGEFRAPQAVPRVERAPSPQPVPRFERAPGPPPAPPIERAPSAPRGTAVPRAPAAPPSHAARGSAGRGR
jgi:hypothetical protein